MNRNTRNTIIFVLAILGVLIITIVLFYITSLRTVAFNFVPGDLEGITVYNRDENEVGKLQENGSLRLQNGEYTYRPLGEMWSTDPVGFTVDSDEEISVNPSYSDDHRYEILRRENPAIVGVINNTFGDTMRDFTIETGTIYQQGDWYATLLSQDSLPGGQDGDIYRIVLHKVDGTWQIAAGPEIVLGAPVYPDVPYEILKDINSR